jgi:hypothetical protein
LGSILAALNNLYPWEKVIEAAAGKGREALLDAFREGIEATLKKAA